MIYDIFYASEFSVNETRWTEFRKRFPTAQRIENIKNLEDISQKAFTKFYWLVWDNVVVLDEFNFDYRVDKWEEDYIHVFKNLTNDKISYQNGVALFPKTVKVSKKEFDHKFYINKKEVDQVASRFQYPRYTFNSHAEYLEVCSKETSPLFWSVPTDVEVVNQDIFNLYFDPKDGTYDYDRNENHVFLNGNFNDGISLLSKNKILSKKEFDFRFPIDKKEWNIVATRPRPYDIIFISYNETYADENFNRLKSKFPRAKRIHGIKGIHRAHIAAAELAETDMFWVVDADAYIVDSFNFEVEYIPRYDAGNREHHLKTVYVYTSKNPINDLEYGYGGVKLFPRELARNLDPTTTDMTTSISDSFKVMSEISNITMFNTDEFSTWRSAFRECVKLVSKVIDRTHQEETLGRLKVWCKVGLDRPFGRYAIGGALSGYFYGKINIGNDPALRKINDFEWLQERFLEYKEKYVNGRNKDKEIYPDNE